MLEPQQSGGAAPETMTAPHREISGNESLRLPLLRDDMDILGFNDEPDYTPKRPWESRRWIITVSAVVLVAVIIGGVVD